ncbi:UDP-xylose and UDP-N-acetylglucosamine transporter-like [Aricia agestis]|uniref:UDP-xylose and UDP-N-acetylglucosamine transporter-like n=1 Tax=Aricia agestis TaxID=91739 RepID=UPI001C206628|nr:UDP-xylose and UDP-N-acetylglucosamine transporter-like [Aricia agestis]
MGTLEIVTKVFVGCCINSFIMEMLMAKAPYSANFITFLQFLFVALQGLITLKYQILKPKVPALQYFVLVLLFFVTSVANNYAYVLHVPSTLHMIIRSASSPASMLVSWCVKRKAPRINAIIGSIVTTVGVVLATYGGASIVEKQTDIYWEWCLGVALLLVMLFVGALTGLQQEILFAKFGRHTQEMLFFTHALPLPLFVSIVPELKNIMLNLTRDIWLVIVLNILSQVFCAQSVHELAAKETSMTVTFILTIRKFVSLLISSIFFKNNLTMLHVVGTVFVVVGTYFYFDFFSARKQKPVSFKKVS